MISASLGADCGPARAAAGAVPGHHRQPAPEPFPGDAASRGLVAPLLADAIGRLHHDQPLAGLLART